MDKKLLTLLLLFPCIFAYAQPKKEPFVDIEHVQKSDNIVRIDFRVDVINDTKDGRLFDINLWLLKNGKQYGKLRKFRIIGTNQKYVAARTESYTIEWDFANEKLRLPKADYTFRIEAIPHARRKTKLWLVGGALLGGAAAIIIPSMQKDPEGNQELPPFDRIPNG